jgi:hypothetical protein
LLLGLALPSTSAVDEPENNQKQYGADRSGDDGGNDPSAEMDAQLGKQPISDQGANDPDADVGNETVTRTSHDVTGQPSRDEAND